jgi:hypothetical protein
MPMLKIGPAASHWFLKERNLRSSIIVSVFREESKVQKQNTPK